MAKKELMNVATAEELAVLDGSYPVEQGPAKIFLPRIEYVSQDQTEGKGKSMKVITEAGTFFKSIQTDELDENNKKVWKNEELGKEIELIILFERKQLKFYDGEKYVSSPIYDTEDQEIPLFKDKKEIDRGTPKELKARKQYQGKSAKGKDISKLEENKILYVLLDGEMYQFSVRGTSMYAFSAYKRTVQPNKVVTVLNSEPQENGSTSWNQITWTVKRPLTTEEVTLVIDSLKKINEALTAEKEYYASKNDSTVEDEDLAKY